MYINIFFHGVESQQLSSLAHRIRGMLMLMLLNLPLWSMNSQTAMFLLLPFSSQNPGSVSALLLWFPSHGATPFVLL